MPISLHRREVKDAVSRYNALVWLAGFTSPQAARKDALSSYRIARDITNYLNDANLHKSCRARFRP